MVSSTQRCGRLAAHELYDRTALKTWSVGRVTLLGDSAHLMSPFMGQGGAMALEDAVALADAVSQYLTLRKLLQHMR